MNFRNSNKTMAVVAVIVVTLFAQLPAVNHWIDLETSNNPHLMTIAEGILALLAVLWASWKNKGESQP